MAQGAVLVSMARETRSGPVGGSNAVFTEYRVNVYSPVCSECCVAPHSLSDKKPCTSRCDHASTAAVGPRARPLVV